MTDALFPTTRGRTRGYDIGEVNEYIESARRVYSGEASDERFTAARIRRAAFTLRRGGYRTAEVDAALERLEDAFATRDREALVARAGGEAAWLEGIEGAAQVLLDRLARPARHRFRTAGILRIGYHFGEVDALADRIVAMLTGQGELDVAEVREAAFRPRRGGYSEAQVDAVLDATVTVMLAAKQPVS